MGEPNSLPNWSIWFRDLLFIFRRKYLSLSIEEKETITNGASQGTNHYVHPFIAPSILNGVWLTDAETKRDIQLVFVTHSATRDDGSANMVGPIRPDEYAERTKVILEDSLWDEEWRPGVLLREQFTERLVETWRYVAEHFERPKSNYGQWPSSSWGDFGFYWICMSDIRSLDKEKLVDDLFRLHLHARTRPVAKAQVWNAFGVYFDKPFWVGTKPTTTYDERIAGYALPPGYADEAWRFPFAETFAVAWRDGLFAIEAEREGLALKLLNHLMAVSLLFGLPAVSVSPRDWVRLAVEPETNQIGGMGVSLYSQTNTMMQQRWNPVSPAVQRHGVLAEGDLRRVVEKASSFVGSRVNELLLLYLYANTFMQTHHEYTAAFLFGWTIIEQDIHKTIAKLAPEKGRRRKFSRYSVDVAIELLRVAGRIDPKRYESLTALRNERNRVAHTGRMVSRPNAQFCLCLAELVLRQLTGIEEGDKVRLEPILW